MIRASWEGYIGLGQLGIPVRLYSATREVQPRFVQLHESDGSPVERQLRCKAEQRPIASKEIIRAVEYAPGKYLPVADRDIPSRENTKAIHIQQFCEPSIIASAYFDKPFYVVPTKGGERAYALLREVLARRNMLAIGTFMRNNREHLATLGVQGDLVMLEQLRYHAELVPRTSINSPSLPKPSPAEIESLSRVIDYFNGPFYIEDYHDEYAEEIQELADRKARGLSAPRRVRQVLEATPESDIIAALTQTLRGQPAKHSGSLVSHTGS